MNARAGVTLKWKLEIPYLLTSEKDAFKKLRKSGALTFFRVTLCTAPGCANEVPKVEDKDGKQAKLFCCKACYEAATKPPEKPKGDDDGKD